MGHVAQVWKKYGMNYGPYNYGISMAFIWAIAFHISMGLPAQ